MGTKSDCLHLKVNLKEKVYLHVNSTTQRCLNKISKTFLIEDFFRFPPVSTIPVMQLELQMSLRLFETALLGYSGTWDWERLNHEKNLKSKISWH
jgi:hypothetical protein